MPLPGPRSSNSWRQDLLSVPCISMSVTLSGSLRPTASSRKGERSYKAAICQHTGSASAREQVYILNMCRGSFSLIPAASSQA